jgi:hypothetical protein
MVVITMSCCSLLLTELQTVLTAAQQLAYTASTQPTSNHLDCIVHQLCC